jgi:hypothetical protein
MPLYNPPGGGGGFFDELEDVTIDYPNLNPYSLVGWDGQNSWTNIGGRVEWIPTLNTTDNNLTPEVTRFGLAYAIAELVWISVDFPLEDVTDFGTGALTLTLPFTSGVHTDMWGGTLHDTNSPDEYYSIKGHLEQNSDIMELWFIDNDKDQQLTATSPVTLNNTDRIHISGWYFRDLGSNG